MHFALYHIDISSHIKIDGIHAKHFLGLTICGKTRTIFLHRPEMHAVYGM